jgi:hypothetical protein
VGGVERKVMDRERGLIQDQPAKDESRPSNWTRYFTLLILINGHESIEYTTEIES